MHLILARPFERDQVRIAARSIPVRLTQSLQVGALLRTGVYVTVFP